MAQNGDGSDGTAQRALRRMAESDPELAARLILHSLPAAAAKLPEGMSYRLELDGLGAWTVSSFGGRGKVAEVLAGADLNGEAFAISTDAETLARVASGRSPVGPLMSGRLKLRGRRRKAMALRRLDPDAGPRDLARLGHAVDADLVFRSLPYAIEPEWTRGHHFTVAYQLVGEGGGTWRVEVDDGAVRVERGLGESPDAIVRIRYSDWLALLSGELTPPDAMRLGMTEVEGQIPPVTRLGRWIDRAEGIDGPELEREQRQRRLQAENAGSWGSKVTTAGASGDAGRPGRDPPPEGRADELRAALRALGAAELARPRARLLGRPRALAGEPRRGPAAHRLQHRQLLRRRGAGDRRPRPVPARGPERRGGGLPRHPAGRRDAPRGLLRPLGEPR